MNGDKRYLGDVFINAENYERQKQFFRDIIESYQWKYGGNFDAATLQEKTPDDFATRAQGEKADLAILSPLLLGKTRIRNLSDSQYIYTDAVKLDRDGTGLDDIDWYKNLENDNVTEALIDIYNQVMAIQQDLDDRKLDSDVYNTFLREDYTPFKTSLSDTLEIFIDDNGNEIPMVNAGLINGLRFILITQQDYDALPESSKKYWRNVYIIRDPEDIPVDYVDPMHLQLTDGYEFRVHDGYLQVTNGLTDAWKDICSLNDLLAGSDIEPLIKDFIENKEFVIEEQSFINSILNVDPDAVNSDWINYPFLSSSLHDDFVETVLINGSSTNVNTTINNTTKFKTVDLNINNIVNGIVTPINTNLSNQISDIRGNLTNLTNKVSPWENRLSSIEGINTSQNTQITDINTRLNGLDKTTSSLGSRITNEISEAKNSITEWKEVKIPGLKYNSATEGVLQSTCLYNEGLKLAYVYLNFEMYIGDEELDVKKDSSGSLYNVGTGKGTQIRKDKKNYEQFYVYAVPPSNTSYQMSSINAKDLIRISDKGEIIFYTQRLKATNQKSHVRAAFLYKYLGFSEYY